MSRHSFIPRIYLKPEFQADDAKYVVNLWLMMKAGRNNIEEFDEQYLISQYSNELDTFATVEDILKVIRKYVERIESPSKLSGWIISLQNIIESKWCEIPEYKLEEVRLCNSDNSEPPLAIVHYLNHISPQLCGYYFENILDYCLRGLIESIWQVQLCGKDAVIAFSKDDQDLIEKLCPTSIPGKILLQSIKQFIAKQINIMTYTDVYNFIDAVKDNETAISKYIHSLSTTGYVQRYKAYKEIQHSIDVEGRYRGLYQHGEMDFLIGNTIIDAKACKNIHLQQWLLQMNIYREIHDSGISKMEIVSFLNNKIYHFTLI